MANDFASKPESERQKHFIDNANLVGHKIVNIRYTTQKEADNFGWYKKGPVLVLEDGREIHIQKDDEGNDAGMAVVFDPKTGNEEYLPNF